MHKKLLIPWPTEVSPQILQEQTRLMIGHRSKEFSDLYGGITGKLAKFFELPADYQPTTTTSSGTLWFDIVGRSIVKKKVLCCVNGVFSPLTQHRTFFLTMLRPTMSNHKVPEEVV